MLRGLREYYSLEMQLKQQSTAGINSDSKQQESGETCSFEQTAARIR
jgi:hypothetical protein